MSKNLPEKLAVNEEIPETVRDDIRHVINIEFDKAMNDILAYIILHEPVSLYRITRETPYGISSVYKKAKRMANDGLIKPSLKHDIDDGRCKGLYEATVKGLLTCIAYKCLDDDILIHKLKIKWQLKTFCSQRVISILKVLPKIIKVYNDMRVIESPRTMMVAILGFASDQAHTKNAEINQVIKDAYDAAFYYIINRLILDSSISSDDIIIGSKDFLVGICINTKEMTIYSCRLCNKGCFLINTSNNHCGLISELKRKVAEVLIT